LILAAAIAGFIYASAVLIIDAVTEMREQKSLEAVQALRGVIDPEADSLTETERIDEAVTNETPPAEPEWTVAPTLPPEPQVTAVVTNPVTAAPASAYEDGEYILWPDGHQQSMASAGDTHETNASVFITHPAASATDAVEAAALEAPKDMPRVDAAPEPTRLPDGIYIPQTTPEPMTRPARAQASPTVTPYPIASLDPYNPAARAAAMNSGVPPEALVTPVPTAAPILPQYKALYAVNPDIVGWVSVEGTKIDFPVMQTGEDNPEYYLNHDFSHNESRNGVPFVDVRCDVSVRNTNLLIYGHNINNREMFGLLHNYTERGYWQKHPVFKFDFLNREAEYEIISVFKARRPKDAKIRVDFKYYEYMDLSEIEIFNEFIARIKRAALYNTGVTPVWGDELVMLSTCSYHIEAGTLVMVGRRIR